MNIFLTSPISFPGLGIEGINPPDGFCIPGTNFEIKFYGVIIAIGVLLAVTYCLRRAKQFGVTQDDILNLVLICLPSAIVGARLYYVIFEWDQFFGPGIPWYRFLDIRSGGLAIYGGVIGAVLGMLIYTRVRKLKIFPCLDLTGIGLLLGQAIGRWGNFFNREAHGGVTTCFLRMGLVENGALQYFHPTFLYESALSCCTSCQRSANSTVRCSLHISHGTAQGAWSSRACARTACGSARSVSASCSQP